jgi:hypothetical protein
LEEIYGKQRIYSLVMELLFKKVMIIFILLMTAGCLEKPKPRTGDFNALVLDALTEEPVPGVKVNIGDRTFNTGIKGTFSLKGLDPGEYLVRMERSWYQLKEITYHHVGKPQLVKFYLQPEELDGRILFSLYKSSNRGIYLLDLKSREIKEIRDLAGKNETSPCWISSNEIAFVQNIDSKRSELLFLNLTSRDVNSFGEGEHPAVAQTSNGPFITYKSAQKIITKIKLNGSDEKKYKLAGYNPVISTKGGIAYIRGNYKSIFIEVGGVEYNFIPDGAYWNYSLGNPCWSPDGTKIAFEAYKDSDGQRAIYYIEEPFENSTMKQITFPSGEKEQHKHPTWGEDDLIYFSGNIVYSSRDDIYGVRFSDNELESNPWIMVSKGSGNKDYPCWGM